MAQRKAGADDLKQEDLESVMADMVLSGAERRAAKRTLSTLQKSLPDLEETDENLKLVKALSMKVDRVVPNIFSECDEEGLGGEEERFASSGPESRSGRASLHSRPDSWED
eukprot:4593869-Karenia_brevis.AAC.1